MFELTTSQAKQQIESLQAMIAYLSSKKKAEKFDVVLLKNWQRSIDILNTKQ